MRKSSHKTAFIVSLLMIIPSLVSAHSLWLNASTYRPESARDVYNTIVYFGYGHMFPVHDFLRREQVREFRLISPEGEESIEAGEGGFLATPLMLNGSGAYTVTSATQKGFYTMYREGERIQHKMGNMEGLSNVIVSLYYEQYAKALISAGETNESDFIEPVGHNIEIVPVTNPYNLKVGDHLPIKVLFNGRPASFCMIEATYVGFSEEEEFAFSTRTDGRGNGVVRLLHPGRWIVFATVRRPARGELEGQALEEKYTASLTFSVR
ncbi:DUF4198 domain protein [Chitinispirillum alkaliphilum]|nr:DUF4198 domain protein [Chitinispirillum alkaliphilum]